MTPVFDIFKRRRPRTVLAAVSAAVLLLAVWLGDRAPQAMGSEQMQMKGLYLLSRIFASPDEPLPDDVLAVNIGYDRELVPVTDRYGLPAGETDITHRRRLATYLEAIRHSGYRCVVLDVFFDSSHISAADSMLFDTLNSMARVVVPSHKGAQISPAINPAITACGDYGVNFNETSFVKYTFRSSHGESMALRAHRYRGGNAYMPGSGAEQSSLFLKLPVAVNEPYTPDGDKTWYNLGVDLLDVYTPEQLSEMAAGKTVVIGDYTTSDMHDTYKGVMSGPVILVNAIGALERGDQKISILAAALIAVVFFSICFCMLTGETPWGMLGLHVGPMMGFCLNMLGSSMALTALWLTLYILFGEMHDALLPGLLLSALALFSTRLNQKYPLCPYVTLKKCYAWSLRRLAVFAPVRTSKSSPSTPPPSASEAES